MAKKKKPAHALQENSLNDLSYEEVQAIKAGALAAPAVAARAMALGAAAATPVLVAEGDSWFDYPPGLDILDNLRRDFGYVISSLAAAGDSLENMAFGTEVDRNFNRQPVPLQSLISTVRATRPAVVLLSGGGNDIAGDELDSYLNHSSTGLPALRIDFLRSQMQGTFRAALRAIVKSLIAVQPTVHIVTHGYGYPPPDGRGVLNFPFGFRFIGPWLKPSFARKGISDTEARRVIRQLIDEYNDLLASVEAEFPGRFHHIDLRSSIKSTEWVNELHLTNDAYRRVARMFHLKIQAVQNLP